MLSRFCFRSRELDFDYSTEFRYEHIRTFVFHWDEQVTKLALRHNYPLPKEISTHSVR